jgi:hypothetical protein
MSYLGFTSVTGEVHDNHDIISVTTTTLGKSQNDYKVKGWGGKVLRKKASKRESR